MNRFDIFKWWDGFRMSGRITTRLFQLAELLFVSALAINNWSGLKGQISALVTAWDNWGNGSKADKVCLSPEEVTHCPLLCQKKLSPEPAAIRKHETARVEVDTITALSAEFGREAYKPSVRIFGSGGCRAPPEIGLYGRRLDDGVILLNLPSPYMVLGFGEMMYQIGQENPRPVLFPPVVAMYGSYSY